MPPDDEQPTPFVSGPVPPDDIERLLRVVEERVRLRAGGAETAPPPTVPGTNEALDPAATFDGESLRDLAAPLFHPGKGGRLVRAAKAMLNVPLRVLGQPQAYFNQSVRRVIGAWADVLAATLDNLAALQREVAAHRARLAELEERLRRLEKDPPPS